MRLFIWLVRAFIFFVLFAFALNNQQTVTVRWFFGLDWQAPLVIVMVLVFGLGCAVGVLAMVPAWWRHRRAARVATVGLGAERTQAERTGPGGDARHTAADGA